MNAFLRIKRTSACLLPTLVGCVLFAQPLWAAEPVQDHMELDGNAIDETDVGNADAFKPDDWGEDDGSATQGYVAGPNVSTPGGDADVSSFIADPNGDTGMDDIFTGGGSKDDLPIEGWAWTTGTPPDKDDLLGVGAAAYLQGGDLLIYDFGSLYAANGTSSIGNWFFKKDIGPCADGSFGVVDSSQPNRPCLPSDEQPASLHTKGDVLVISENSDGGKVTNISVYTWVEGDASQCSGPGKSFVPPKNNLCLVGEFAGSTCGSGFEDPFVCGIMNLAATESPDTYGYLSKFPPAPGPANPAGGVDGIGVDDYPALTFFESGINISEVLGEALCFSSFMKNTRTSARARSQLKDFASGAFGLCGITVSKSCPNSRVGATGGYCQFSDSACSSNADCDTASSEQCLTTNPLFLFGDTIRTQFNVTIGKKGPANLANVQLNEVSLDGCDVIAEDGVSRATPQALTKNTFAQVLSSLTGDTVLTLECDSSQAVSTNKVIVKAVTSTGSSVGPEEFTMVDNDCAPAPSPGLNIAKQCDGAVKLFVDSNGDLAFRVPVKVTVSNTGDENLENIVVSDDKIGTIDSDLDLAKGAAAKVYNVSYDTTAPDLPADELEEWLGCEVMFSDKASIDAARGVFSGPLTSGELPPDATATCVFCPNCTN